MYYAKLCNFHESRSDAEEFLTNLVNQVNKTNGQLPADYVMKLTEMINLSSPTKINGAKQVNSKVSEIWRGNRIDSVDKVSNMSTARTKNVDEYDFCLTYLETLATTMTAKYLEVRALHE